MIAGLILAGGRSSRMGGQDKSLLVLAGRTLLDRAIDRLIGQIHPLAISSNADLTAHARGLPLLPDQFPGFQGPLAGIHAGLVWAAGLPGVTHLATVSVDAPFIPGDFAARLADRHAATERPVIMASSANRRHPTCALWAVSLEATLSGFLAEGITRRVEDFARACGFAVVDFAIDGPDPFFNVNRPEDVEIAARWIERGS